MCPQRWRERETRYLEGNGRCAVTRSLQQLHGASAKKKKKKKNLTLGFSTFKGQQILETWMAVELILQQMDGYRWNEKCTLKV
jgi:hypothetical protein